MITPLKAYKCYVSLKTHFNTKTYDFFKMKGRVKANYESLQNRNDMIFFKKIAGHKSPYEYILANFVTDKSLTVSDFNDKNYERYERIKSTMTNEFEKTLNKIDNIDDFLKISNGSSKMLNMFMSGQIEPEIICIFDKMYNIFDYWLNNITNLFLVDSIEMLKKYSPFVDVDIEKFKQITINKYDPLRSL